MSKDTKIEWAHHSFNAWWGCRKISPACDNCYAEAMAKRTGRDCFGPSPRYRTKGPWKEVVKWDRDAGKRGVRERLFVNSMSDFFEDNDELHEWRVDALMILEDMQNLDVMFLTKRPAIAAKYFDEYYHDLPDHFWVGVTAENQSFYNLRVDALQTIPAKVKFVSIEPMLGMIDMGDYLSEEIDWVITGAESGHRSRVAKVQWFRSLQYQCKEAGVPFMLKQMHVDEGTGLDTKIKLVKKPFLDGVQYLEIPRVKS